MKRFTILVACLWAAGLAGIFEYLIVMGALEGEEWPTTIVFNRFHEGWLELAVVFPIVVLVSLYAAWGAGEPPRER